MKRFFKNSCVFFTAIMLLGLLDCIPQFMLSARDAGPCGQTWEEAHQRFIFRRLSLYRGVI